MSSQNISIEKTWAVVYGDYLLLEAPTRGELRTKMNRTRLPDGHEIVALPKAHGSMIV